MSRYIDADYILDGIKNDRALIQDGKMDKYKEHYLSFLERCVEHTPSIDIVRCKECKEWDKNDHECYLDRGGLYFPNADDYCSYGEREGE